MFPTFLRRFSTVAAAGAVKAFRRKSYRTQKRWKKKKSIPDGGEEKKTVTEKPAKKLANHFFAVKISDCQVSLLV